MFIFVAVGGCGGGVDGVGVGFGVGLAPFVSFFSAAAVDAG